MFDMMILTVWVLRELSEEEYVTYCMWHLMWSIDYSVDSISANVPEFLTRAIQTTGQSLRCAGPIQWDQVPMVLKLNHPKNKLQGVF